MKRLIAWGLPSGDDWRLVYTSKCGRYTIQRRRYASARNGCFATVAYVLTLPGGETKTTDTLRDAKDEAETHNDPNWEP